MLPYITYSCSSLGCCNSLQQALIIHNKIYFINTTLSLKLIMNDAYCYGLNCAPSQIHMLKP